MNIIKLLALCLLLMPTTSFAGLPDLDPPFDFINVFNNLAYLVGAVAFVAGLVNWISGRSIIHIASSLVILSAPNLIEYIYSIPVTASELVVVTKAPPSFNASQATLDNKSQQFSTTKFSVCIETLKPGDTFTSPMNRNVKLTEITDYFVIGVNEFGEQEVIPKAEVKCENEG